MKETHEFRIFEEYYNLIPKPNGAKFNGAVYVLNIKKEDPLFQVIGRLKRNNNAFFVSWRVKRNYTKKELADAKLFHFSIKTAFEPTGEECGTMYDEKSACEICGANRIQIGSLKLKKGTIPKKDIARTIAGEIVVSERFATVFKQRGLSGANFAPVVYEDALSNYRQLMASSPELELTDKTKAGDNPFMVSTGSAESVYNICGYEIEDQAEVYLCPKGHLIGLNLLSEPFVFYSPSINKFDFFVSRQKTGVRRGLLQPEPIYFCSSAFRRMVEEENLTGFEFEIAHIE